MTLLDGRPAAPAPRPLRPTRRGRWAAAVGLVLLLAVASAVSFASVLGRGPLAPWLAGPSCSARFGDATVELSEEQAQHAATIAAEGVRRGLPVRAVVVALATAYQESDLRNLAGGDRDSAGLFQQRPSQGWGTYAEVTDPRTSAAAFYDALVRVPDWRESPVTEAAQAVQRSAFPTAYADHEADARVLALALTGDSAGDLTCSVTPDRVERQAENRAGLTPRAAALRRDLEAAFGPQSLGGFAPGGVSTGHIEGSAHYDGRAVDVFFRPVGDRAQAARGWAVAHWLVAHAGRLDVATVIYADRIWSAGRSGEGWRPYSPSELSADPEVAAIQRHLDHVHVDVLEGG